MDRTRLSGRAGTGKGAFSLVELLVVIAMLSLLVTIILPTLGNAREMGRRTLCGNNQHELAKALQAYASQYRYFPYNYWDKSLYTGPANEDNNRWQLGILNPFLGGGNDVVLKDKEIGQFPGTYVCPSADLGAVYQNRPSYRYHACYFTNPAVRLNLGWRDADPRLVGPSGGSSSPPHIDDNHSVGLARIWGTSCPNGAAHWRSVYHPILDSMPDASTIVNTGDTSNSGVSGCSAGDWAIRPGLGQAGEVAGYIGWPLFSRHRGKLMLGYVDGHVSTLDHDAMEAGFTVLNNEPTGDFLVRYPASYGCGGTGVHSLPRGPVN